MNLHVLQDSRKRLEGHGKSWQGLRWHHFQLCQKPPCPPRLHGKTWRVLTGFKMFDLSGKIPVSELQSCSCYLGLAIWSHYLDLAIPVLRSWSCYLCHTILVSLSWSRYLDFVISILPSWSHFLNLTIPVLLSHSLSWSCYLKLAISILLSRSPQSCYLNLTIAILLSQSCYRNPYEASLKVSWRSNILNPVKTPHVLQVSSWSLGGHGGSWQSWKWCQGARATHRKLPWKFH